jgi:hypothetical protein
MRRAILAGVLMLVAPQARADEPPAPAAPAPAPAPAPPASARTALEEQRYADALAMVRPDFESPDLARRAEAFEIAAIALLLDARPAEAALYLHALFEIAPGFRLADPSLPPRVTAPFEAEAARPHERAISLAIEAGEPGAGYAIKLSRAAPLVLVHCRPSDAGEYVTVPVTTTTPTRPRFQLPSNGAYGCFAEAAETPTITLGRLGSREHPIVVRPQPPRPAESLTSQWWFWTAAGAVVLAGAGLTAYLVSAQSPQDPPRAELTVRAQGFRFP